MYIYMCTFIYIYIYKYIYIYIYIYIYTKRASARALKMSEIERECARKSACLIHRVRACAIEKEHLIEGEREKLLCRHVILSAAVPVALSVTLVR